MEDIIGKVICETEISVIVIGDTDINVALMEIERVAQPSSYEIWLRDELVVIKSYHLQDDDDSILNDLLSKSAIVIEKSIEEFGDAFRSEIDEVIKRLDNLLEEKCVGTERNPFYYMFS